MSVTGNELKGLLGEIGVRPATAQAVDPAQPLLRQGLDSADCPAFAALLEERYGLDLEEQESLSLRTLDDYAAYINAKKKGA